MVCFLFFQCIRMEGLWNIQVSGETFLTIFVCWKNGLGKVQHCPNLPVTLPDGCYQSNFMTGLVRQDALNLCSSKVLGNHSNWEKVATRGGGVGTWVSRHCCSFFFGCAAVLAAACGI